MAILPSIADISQAIQLSIAPVFLLVGIAGKGTKTRRL